ncbi:MAG TPA: DUF6236 family protein [Dehalococcoidia bacterium]
MEPSEFFDVLQREDLADAESAKRRLGLSSRRELLRLDERLANAVRELDSEKSFSRPNSYDFWPSGELGCGNTGCKGPECRGKRSQAIARFALLWADTVTLPPQFGVFDHVPGDDSIRDWMFGSVLVVTQAEAAIRSKVVKLAAPGYLLCNECGLDFEATKGQAGTKVRAASKALEALYGGQVQGQLVSLDGDLIFMLSGPEDLMPHGGQGVSFGPGYDRSWLPHTVLKKISNGETFQYDIPKTRLPRTGLLKHVLETAETDVINEHLACRMRGTRYLTHRPADAAFLNAINDSDEYAEWNRVLATALPLQMPILKDAPLEDLLELRAKDYDAFLVYRDTINASINARIDSGVVPSEKQLAEIFRDEISPQLNKMNQKLRATQKRLSGKLKRNLVISLGTVLLGLSTGLVAPTLMALLAGAGGTKLVADIGGNLLESRNADDELSSENLYFLWRLQTQSS